MSLHEKQVFPHKATFLGKVKTTKKVVVAIDLGTTYSGVSFVYRDDPSTVNCGAPGLSASRDSIKVPTLLLEKSGEWLFGQEAHDTYNDLVEEAHDTEYVSDVGNAGDLLSQRGIHLYRFFKLKLKKQESGVETIMVKSTSGHEHKLIDLITHSLKALSTFAMKEIQAGFGAALGITRNDVLWVITVPAIWTDFGKAFMRKAAFRAGLVTDEASDSLLLALEPECASIAVHQEGYKLGLFKEGAIFLVLDCGGGTVDITIHRVATVEPLVLDEEALPDGGTWGSIFVCNSHVVKFHINIYALIDSFPFVDIQVDREFTGKFLKDFLGERILRRLQKCFPHELDELNEQFRILKEGFVPGGKGKKMYRISFSNILRRDIRSKLGISVSILAVEYKSQRYTRPQETSDSTHSFLSGSFKASRRLQHQYGLHRVRPDRCHTHEENSSRFCPDLFGCTNVGVLRANHDKNLRLRQGYSRKEQRGVNHCYGGRLRS